MLDVQRKSGIVPFLTQNNHVVPKIIMWYPKSRTIFSTFEVDARTDFLSVSPCAILALLNVKAYAWVTLPQRYEHF